MSVQKQTTHVCLRCMVCAAALPFTSYRRVPRDGGPELVLGWPALTVFAMALTKGLDHLFSPISVSFTVSSCVSRHCPFLSDTKDVA